MSAAELITDFRTAQAAKLLRAYRAIVARLAAGEELDAKATAELSKLLDSLGLELKTLDADVGVVKQAEYAKTLLVDPEIAERWHQEGAELLNEMKRLQSEVIPDLRKRGMNLQSDSQNARRNRCHLNRLHSDNPRLFAE